MALYDPLPRCPEIDLRAAAARLKITEGQAANLLALARGLMRLPEDYGYFNMSYYFFSTKTDFGFNSGVITPGMPAPGRCGAVGCALGHAPSILGIAAERYEPWADYGKRVLGVGNSTPDGWLLWNYLFDGHWCSTDNTPRGAGQRILRALRRGVPEGFDPEFLTESPDDFDPVADPFTLDYKEETL